MKRRKVTVAVLSVVLAAAALTGCGSAQQTNGPKKTRVVLNEVAHSIFYAPMYVAIEEGYFEDAGINLELVTGFGADKTMTAVLTGEADIGFMGSESTIYTYAGGTEDYVVNFAQLTQRAGNFLVAREPIDDFSWDMLKGTTVLGGRAGGMPEMVFEYILEKNNMDPTTDLSIDQSIDFGSTAAAFSGGQGDFTIEFEPHATLLEQKGDGYVVPLWVKNPVMFLIPRSQQRRVTWKKIPRPFRHSLMPCKKAWITYRSIVRRKLPSVLHPSLPRPKVTH